jgi:hypothetical protein
VLRRGTSGRGSGRHRSGAGGGRHIGGRFRRALGCGESTRDQGDIRNDSVGKVEISLNAKRINLIIVIGEAELRSDHFFTGMYVARLLKPQFRIYLHLCCSRVVYSSS